MRKIGILTYHTGSNYGASLQAYALQTTLNRLGANCEIIHFETEDFLSSREMFSHRPKRLKEWIKLTTRLPWCRSLLKRQACFDDFTDRYLTKSPLYRHEEQVIQAAENYDCIICGSDQIWSLDRKIDPYAANPIYFLNFPKKQRRVSYAASFGKFVQKAPEQEEEFLPWLRQFDMVSVREISGLEYLQSRDIPCQVTLDPTLLLDAEDYNCICVPRLVDHPYALLFSWHCDQDAVQTAKSVAHQLRLPLLNIVPPPRALGSGIPRKLDVGPREFLSMIRYAEFVVTNSFHGTAFSTIYEKPYVSVVSGQADPRMKSLLQQLGLEDHLVLANQVDIERLSHTDYVSVRDKKAALRQSSIDFLKRAIEG